jgi:predicted GNAT family acetyltransferase
VSADSFASKAGINAEGRCWVQLGGVYTIPACRSKGWACKAVLSVVEYTEQRGKQCALFVREENCAAYHLYRTAGFIPVNSYIIAYY